MKALAVLCLLCATALAQPTPAPPGLTRVNHDATMTGDGKALTPLSTRLAVGGGLQGGGAVSLGLITTCGTGQTLKWSGSAWACADLSSIVTGTLHRLACFTPDGSHVGNCNATDDGTTLTLGTTVALTEATGLIAITNVGSLGTSNLVLINGTNVAEGLATVNTLSSATWGSAGMAGRVSGTVDTTGSGGIAAVGVKATVDTTRIAGTDPLNNYAFMADASGSPTFNIGVYSTASGTGAYTFYGAGTAAFFQTGTGTFNSSLFADGSLRVIDTTASSARIVQTNNSIDLATVGPGAGSCTNCSATHDQWGRVTAYSSGTAPVTTVNVATPITSTGGTTPTIGISEGNGITNSGGAIVVNNGTGLNFAAGALKIADTAVTAGSCTYCSLTVNGQGQLTAQSSGTAPLTAANLGGTTNRLLKITGTNTAGNSSITDDGTNVSTTENINGTTANFTSSTASATFTAYANGTNRAANINGLDNETFASFDTSAAARTGYGLQAWSYGTKGIAGHTLTNIAVYATAFNGDVNQDFYGASGDFLQLGIGEFGGALKADTTLKVGAGGDAAGAANTAALATNAGTTCSEVRDSTNHVEAEHCASASGAFFGSYTNNSAFIQSNATNAIKIDTSQNVEIFQNTTHDGTTTATGLVSFGSHIRTTGTALTTGNLSSCGTTPGITANSTDLTGQIIEGTTATGCVVAFTNTYTVKPFCQCTFVAAGGGAGFGGSATGCLASSTALTIWNSSASNTIVTYWCSGVTGST